MNTHSYHGILLQRSPPGNRGREHEGVEARLVETLADIATGRHGRQPFSFGDCRRLLSCHQLFPRAHATTENDPLTHPTSQAPCQFVEVRGALRKHERCPPFFEDSQQISTKGEIWHDCAQAGDASRRRDDTPQGREDP